MKTLIYNTTAILMDEQRTVLNNAYVVIEDTKIFALGSGTYDGAVDETIDGKGNILMPGFVNAHSHSPMVAMRGYGDGNNLQDWLHNFIFPVEARWDSRSIKSATGLGICEMLASGITTTADMYMLCDDIAGAFAQSGMSAHIDGSCTQFGDSFDPETHKDIIQLKEMTKKWHGFNDGQILVNASLHAEYTSTSPLQEYLGSYAKEHNLMMHVHISETKHEHDECIKRNGLTPIQYLDERGLFETRSLSAHSVWTTPEDWAIMARKNITAVHNPVCNLKIGSGVAPITKMREAGVNIAIGTDGVSSNNCTDFFGDLKLAAILQNGVNHNPQALSSWDALEMATINGAKALGRDIGQIRVGSMADLVLVDTDALNMIPCHDPVNNIVYSAHSSNVLMTMCRGKIVYKNGEFLTLDVEKIKYEVKNYAVPLLFNLK